MWKNKLAGLVGVGLMGLATAPQSQGQGLGNSPYSRLGLGDFNLNTGGARQQGMGGVGLAAPNSVHINELNPALLYYTARTTYEMAVNGQIKTLRNQTNSQRDGSGTLGYLALAVPLSKSWAGAVGLKPYSAVDYESNVIETVAAGPAGTQVLKRYQGEGGLSEAYIGQAYRLAKGLTVGGTAAYVFGSIDQRVATQVAPAGVTDPSQLASVVLLEHVRYSDFTFRGAVHYRGAINSKLNYSLGGVYTFRSSIDGVRNTSLDREDVAGNQLERIQLEDSQKGEARVPAMAQFGISIDNNKNFSANLDVAHQQWSKFRSFGITGGAGIGTPLDNTVRVGLGGEYTPDPTSVDNYFKRVTYRAGISAAQLPYRPAGQTLYDRAVSWGFSLPVPSATPLEAASMNLAFTYGQRGNTDPNVDNPNGNVREDYVRVQLGLTLNNRWFIKRRIE
ncbi:OmpP1/FadL family transporter [Hymenobacter qilianensis]|nr:hypothetical protein [Hymenobacter qilianensis]